MKSEKAFHILVHRSTQLTATYHRLLTWEEEDTLQENMKACGFPGTALTQQFATRYGLRFRSLRQGLPKGVSLTQKSLLKDAAIKILKEKGFTFQELALLLGCSKQMIQQRYGGASRTKLFAWRKMSPCAR